MLKRETDIEITSHKIYKMGIEKCIHPDIIRVVMMYYMSLNNTDSLDIENILTICNKYKDMFIEAITSQKNAIHYYSNNDELKENAELQKAKNDLVDIQAAIGMYYYNLKNGKTFYKRKDAIILFEKLVIYNNPVVQNYLGWYYMTECYDYWKQKKGIALCNNSKKYREYIHAKELEYKSLVENILKQTLYKSHEEATLEFTIKVAEEKVEELSKKLKRIHYIKDSVKVKAIQDITNTIEYVYNNLV